MSRRVHPEPLIRVGLNLHEADHERFQAMFKVIGVSGAVRQLMRQYLQRVDSRAAIKPEEIPEVNLEELDDVPDQ